MALVGVRGDEAGRILEVNEALVDLTGPAARGAHRLELAPGAHASRRRRLRRASGLERLVRGRDPDLAHRVPAAWARGRQVRWVDLTASTVHDADGEPLYRISQLQDIDARRRGEERLRHLADHDTLSGLFNRRRFHEELEREVRARRARRRAADRPRQVQGGQRHARSRGGRRGDRAGRRRRSRSGCGPATSPRGWAATSSGSSCAASRRPRRTGWRPSCSSTSRRRCTRRPRARACR